MAVIRKRPGAPFSVPVPQNCARLLPETTSISMAALSKVTRVPGIQNLAAPLGAADWPEAEFTLNVKCALLFTGPAAV